MTLSLKDANTRFALLKAFADAIYSEIATNREIHTARLVERYTEEGTKSFDVLLAGGVKVGSISLTVPKATTTVTDEAAFLAWCKDNRPDDVWFTPGMPAIVERTVHPPTPDSWEVNPKATTTILKESRPGDDGEVVDVTGCVIDGVTYTNGAAPSQFSVRYETDGREALALAYRRGELNDLASGSALPAIGAS